MSPGEALPLRDIHLPPEPPWWPPAPGWWLLAALLLILLLVAGRWLAARWRLRRARRRLLAACAELERRHPPREQPLAWLAGASELLRRAVRQHAPEALPLQGEAWVRFLDGGRADAPYSTGAGRLLLDGPYLRQLEADAIDGLPALLRERLDTLPEARR